MIASALLLGPADGPILAGRSLRDHARERLAEAAVDPVLTAAAGGDIAAIRRLIAGGALPADRPLFLIAGDVAWFDGPVASLSRLASCLNPDRFDAVLLLARATEGGSLEADGLALDPLGTVRRPGEREIPPFVFAGVQILRPSLLESAPATMTGIWDRAMTQGRLGGLVHDSIWFQISSPLEAEAAEASFEDRLAGIRL